MCAIAGIISQNPSYYLLQLLDPILSAMSHRGPSGTATELLNHQGCFGHNRLAIIDLNERAKQPMWDYSHRYCLTFNGEIYNYQSLRQELIGLGHHFRTTSDSEVLIEAWAEWQIAALDHLVGMFAFAIWDNQKKYLYLARDRMGEKPLYYAPIHQKFKNGIVFASELKGLVQYPFIIKNLSLSALNHYLSFGYVSTEEVIFKGIYKLPPASYLFFDANTDEIKVTEYWSLAYYFNHKKNLNFSESKSELNALLEKTIKQETIADVPLGAFLSGGIDSSTIVAHMCQNDPNQIHTYSIGFHEKSYSELAISQQTAEYLGIKHQTQVVNPNIRDLLPKLAYTFDEPFADTSLIPTYLLCEFAKQYVTVSLSGDGGDELFGGYITYQADRYYHWMQYLPIFVRKALIKTSQYLPTSFAKISTDYKIKQFLRGCLLNFHEAHLSWREIFNCSQKRALFQESYHHLILQNPIRKDAQWFQNVSECHWLDQVMYVDMKTWLVDNILLKTDRASMANSLELRAPFLDHRLVEFAASLPTSYRLSGNQGKYILRESQKKYLPPHVLHQPKRGFNSPISHWLTGDLFEMAYEITTGSLLSQWFNKAFVKKMWLEHKRKSCDNGYRLFNLLCLGLWCQSYLLKNPC